MSVAKRRRVGPSDPMAVVTRFIDAANHHDADALYASVHPDFESFQPLHPARDFRGPGQLITNWKAIFEAEPGFRLTVLRASTTGNTVWVEVHGAGASAEAAGIFIVGVEDARIRWIRVYSDLIEPVVEQPATVAPPAEATAERPPATEEWAALRLVEGQPVEPVDYDEGWAQTDHGLRLVEPVPSATGPTPEGRTPEDDSAEGDGTESVEVLVGSPFDEAAEGAAATDDPAQVADAAGDEPDAGGNEPDAGVPDPGVPEALRAEPPSDRHSPRPATTGGWRKALKIRR